MIFFGGVGMSVFLVKYVKVSLCNYLMLIYLVFAKFVLTMKFKCLEQQINQHEVVKKCFKNLIKLFSLTKNQIMSCEIKLRCANTTTIYVSRIQNQTVSDVILQVCLYVHCTCNQNLGSSNSFIQKLPAIFGLKSRLRTKKTTLNSK